MSATFTDGITTREALEEHYGQPRGHLSRKELPRLNSHSKQFISLSPFLVLSTSAAGDGPADASPRGDAPGFVRVLDDTTIAIPDRPGNRRTDSFHNVMENPEVGLLFMVPGMNEIMRINGRAHLTVDLELLATLEAKGKLPRAALVVEIRDVYMHCGKAIIRADLWNPEIQIDREDFPTMGQVNEDWYGVDGKAVDEKLAKDYIDTLY
ncbi:MAG: pyridoxamine 5'-phosphate oxidase family protein [Alphaproteobacteria bacterium]|nr:pyridoxamine 5'-phosphate oxidase family protein [Alphaproteobacteria bacterium]